jgi:hypothetical protein
VNLRPQPGAIGTQRVGQHESVEAIIFVAGRTVAAAQILDLIGADDDDGQATGEQSVDHRSIGAFDGDLSDTVFGEQVEQAAQARIAVLDGLTRDLLTAGINNRDRVIVASPVDSSGQAVGRLVGQRNWGTLQHSLLAAEPSGEAPDFRCQNVTAASLTDRRSSAHSPVDGRHALRTAGSRKTHAGRQPRQASRAMTRQHLGCIDNPSKITDLRMVHQ